MRRTTSKFERIARPHIKHVAVGHDAIDADHEKIVECCGIIADTPADVMEFQLLRLHALLINHFEHEELLIRATGSTLCTCHAIDHKAILNLSQRAIETCAEDHETAQRLVIREIVPALRKHITNQDQLLALYLNSAHMNSTQPTNPRKH